MKNLESVPGSKTSRPPDDKKNRNLSIETQSARSLKEEMDMGPNLDISFVLNELKNDPNSYSLEIHDDFVRVHNKSINSEFYATRDGEEIDKLKSWQAEKYKKMD